MTIRRLFQILYGTLLALVFALATIAVLLFINQRNLGHSQQIRFQSYLLAEELRQSGDDLTRFAQTYVVTGEPRYEQYYWETLAIRNGQSPLPEHYDERNHWDFEAATERTPQNGMRAVSLLQRLKEIGVTEAEFTKLKEMNTRSDALVATETVAFNALKGLYDDGTGHFTRRGQPNREMAIRLMHDEAYRFTKVNIMKPIDEFFAMLEARTAASMEGYQRQGTLFLLGILSICGLLIALALVSFVVVQRRIWTPVGALQRQTQMVAADMDRLAEVTNKIAAGELDRAFVVDTQPLRPFSPDEIGSLMRKHDEMIAHLQKTGNAIATLTATQKRTQESLRRARDQSEEALRASEERWSKLAENSSAGIALIAPDGRFIAANLALQEMLGYTENELQGCTTSDITHPEDRAATEARIAEANEGQRRAYRLEKRFLRKDGSVMWADVSSVFVPASGNNTAFFSAVIVDRTESKQAEEELHKKEVSLREAQIELAHISRVTTMGELTASIAHEINQPLAAVVNNASACLRWLTAHNLEEARQSASLVIAEGHRAGEIISRIRALARKAPPQKDWLNLNETIGEVIAMARSAVQRNRISLQTQLANDLPLILGDRIQLQQVILNLLINAIEAMRGVGEGPRELWVSSQKVTEIPGESEENTLADKALAEAEGAHVLVAVRDSGPGLDPKGVNRLFDTFYSTKPQGLGMGLAISRSIIEAHGGRLWAKANAPRGAVFQFGLPIREERMS